MKECNECEGIPAEHFGHEHPEFFVPDGACQNQNEQTDNDVKNRLKKKGLLKGMKPEEEFMDQPIACPVKG